MRRFIVLSTLTLGFLFAGRLEAQDYQSAAGLRLGYPISATYKHFILGSSAVEGFAGIRPFPNYSWISLGAVYEIHLPVEGVRGLMWYFGGGGSVYFYNFRDDLKDNGYATTSFGALGIIGLDFSFRNPSPFNLSLDWIPAFRFNKNGYRKGFDAGLGALSIRYKLN